MNWQWWPFVFLVKLTTFACEKPFTIIICSYNNQEWVEHNLDSVFSQDYNNYRVIYIDDCSTDRTTDKVNQYLNKHHLTHQCTLITNTTRKYKLRNLYYGIHQHCKDDEIVVEVDGDDWLLHDSVLSLLNTLYQSNKVWMTYGGCRTWPKVYQSLQTELIPAQVIKDNTFRAFHKQGNIVLALRSFYAGLFKQIEKNDLIEQEKFLTTGSDIATMLPMFEMAGDRFAHINELVYLYNVGTGINDFRRDRYGQMKVAAFIRTRPPYHRLAKAPF